MSDQNRQERPKSKNYAYLRRTFDFMRPYSRQMVIFTIALLLTSAATLSIGVGLKFVVDQGLSAGSQETLDKASPFSLALSFL